MCIDLFCNPEPTAIKGLELKAESQLQELDIIVFNIIHETLNVFNSKLPRKLFRKLLG
jgi:hypothetical protein